LLEGRLDGRKVQRVGLGLRRPATTPVNVGRLERVLDLPGDAVGGFLAQLTQDDGGERPRSSMDLNWKIEQDRDRDGDHDREASGEPQAAISNQMADKGGADASGRRTPRSQACPSSQAYSI
jgi:hypothetical protein